MGRKPDAMHAPRTQVVRLRSVLVKFALVAATACGDREESDDGSAESWTAGSASGSGLGSASGASSDDSSDDPEPDACREDGTSCSAEDECCDGLHCVGGSCGACTGEYPVFCPESGEIPASCWSDGTDCATATDCNGNFLSCDYSVLQVDCSTKTCECPDPDFPDFCPPLGDVPANCWSAGVACGTVVDCAGEHHGCLSSDYIFDCDSGTCVSTGGASSASGGDDSSGCSYDSECGYDEICRYGQCETPECTHDSDCHGDCDRCSDNMCHVCVVGPYGCTC